MTDKATYLSNLEALSYVQEIGTPVLREDKTGVNLKVYDVDILEMGNSNRTQVISHKFAVYDEGGGSEAAYSYGPPYVPYYRENDPVYAAVATYVEGLGPVKGFSISEYDTDNQWAKVRVFVFVTDHIEEKQYLIYNDGGLTHEEIQ